MRTSLNETCLKCPASLACVSEVVRTAAFCMTCRKYFAIPEIEVGVFISAPFGPSIYVDDKCKLLRDFRRGNEDDFRTYMGHLHCTHCMEKIIRRNV